jgi:homocysteine S-methyltransferase
MMGLIQDLKDHVVVADGAMGTLLYANGVDRCFEELNVSEPTQIYQIHQAYLKAGAQVIQTNTYAANAYKMARYGLENEVENVNIAGARLAKKAAAGKAYVLGTIGGIRGIKKDAVGLDEIKQNFLQQLYCLLKENVDGILLETYYDLEELTTVLSLARKETRLPIVAQVSLHEAGVLQNGTPLSEALDQLQALGADVVGLNCRLGPYHMVSSLKDVPLFERAFLSAYPNAGLPEYVDGKLVYQSDPTYFEKSALLFREEGVRLIGGCCGTTPEHIEAMARVLKGEKPVSSKAVEKRVAPLEIITRKPSGENDFHELAKTRRSVIVELDPPRKLDTTRFFQGVEALKEAGIDALTMADNSLASPRISNVSMATVIKERYGVRPLVHVACRDRNLIGLQSHLMGLSALGIHQLLAITGDPTKVGDFPGATSVYDCSSFDLIRLCKQFNEGLSPSGKSLGQQTSFSVGAAFNPNVHHLDKAVRRMEKKIKAGADFFMTQPVYSEQQIVDIREATKHLEEPIYIGIMPLVSAQNAEFLHNEVPGIHLSDEIRKRMVRFTNDRQAASQEGIAIAKSLLDTALDLFNGVYLLTPFMRYDITVELVSYIHQRTGQSIGIR